MQKLQSWCQVEVPPPPRSDQACAASPERSPGCFWNIRDLLSSYRALTLVAPLPENVPLTPNQLGFVYRNWWNVCKECCHVVSEDSPGSRERRTQKTHLKWRWSNHRLPMVRYLYCVSISALASGVVFLKPKGEIFVWGSLDFCCSGRCPCCFCLNKKVRISLTKTFFCKLLKGFI